MNVGETNMDGGMNEGDIVSCDNNRQSEPTQLISDQKRDLEPKDQI